jgi:hypothetical protein
MNVTWYQKFFFSMEQVLFYHHYHHHHLANIELDHSLTLSGLTHPEAPLIVSSCPFCLLVSSLY